MKNLLVNESLSGEILVSGVSSSYIETKTQHSHK